jgi:hypothetical protein
MRGRRGQLRGAGRLRWHMYQFRGHKTKRGAKRIASGVYRRIDEEMEIRALWCQGTDLIRVDAAPFELEGQEEREALFLQDEVCASVHKKKDEQWVAERTSESSRRC